LATAKAAHLCARGAGELHCRSQRDHTHGHIVSKGVRDRHGVNGARGHLLGPAVLRADRLVVRPANDRPLSLLLLLPRPILVRIVVRLWALMPEVGRALVVLVACPAHVSQLTLKEDACRRKRTTGEPSPSHRRRGGEEGVYIPVDVTKSVDGYMDLRREIQVLAPLSLCFGASACFAVRRHGALLKAAHALCRNSSSNSRQPRAHLETPQWRRLHARRCPEGRPRSHR
jgi:hypothetical protein